MKSWKLAVFKLSFPEWLVNQMKWLINTLLSVIFFAITLVVGLLLINSFMTIAVAQTNHALGDGVGALNDEDASSGANIGISKDSGGGFVIRTKDGSMALTGDGIEVLN